MSDKEENMNGDAMPTLYVRDFPFFGNQSFDPQKIESAMDYTPRDGDIVLSAYPKTGSTWMQYIIWQILHKGESYPNFGQMSFNCAPYIELTGAKAIEALSAPRYFKMHLPYHMVKANEKAKYIYIHRNPSDIVVSYYHFVKSMYARPLKFDDFFEKFLAGSVPYGDYFDHLKSFYEQKDKPHVFMISYEDLRKDTKMQILRLAKFLGDEYYQTFCKDDALLQNVLNVTSFKYMKEHLEVYSMEEKDGSLEKRNFEMFRKGVVGEGKKLLSQQQIEKLNQKMIEKMKDTDFPLLWSNQ